MKISLNINGLIRDIDVRPSDTLLSVLRRNGFLGAKFGGCRLGECGACTVLIDGKTINSCSILAASVVGHKIETIESLGQHPDQGWKKTEGLSVIQQAFVDSGAIQCGYCTPAMVLAAEALLRKNQNPTEKEIRDILSGILCRCTGYVKPIQAVQRAAALLRGDPVQKVQDLFQVSQKKGDEPSDEWLATPGGLLDNIDNNISTDHLPVSQKQRVLPKIWSTPEVLSRKVIGKAERKVDALKLVQGKPAFTDDVSLPNMLIAKVLHSPVAHARIARIDVSKAQSLPGVAAVLTYKDIPRVVYSTAGQSDPIPGPLDTFSLDLKVRFVGDRVAFVAAESEDIARKAIELIDVEYDILPSVVAPQNAMLPDAIIIHDEPEYVNFADSDPSRNLAAKIRIDIGDVDSGFSAADFVVEGTYEVPKVQQAHIEPHVVITYWDEDDRLVVRSSTQVPFHTRRILAPVLGLPVKRIRVIKPRIGGGFGGKQEVLIEDVAAHLTIATGRPVKYEYTREEEFISARSRHPMKIKMKTGVLKDGTITANEMICLSDTGSYGCHALTVTGNTGHKAMALYIGDTPYRESPNIRFYADIVYTNTPPSGAFRGYGVPQGFWAVERHMEKIAHELHIDPISFRLKNALRSGEIHPFSASWSEGREPRPEIIQTVGLEQCVKQGMAAVDWNTKFGNEKWHVVPGKPFLRRGIGVAMVMQGTAIPYLDMGGASIKLNDDGSFNLLVGATDLGTGSDTVLAQMAAEVLGVVTDDIVVYSSDTDFTPFDKGAYASSTTYISGSAVVKAAEIVADKIRKRAARMLSGAGEIVHPETIILSDKKASEPGGRSVSMAEIAHNSLHHDDQEQIMAVASFMSPVSPPPFAAQFAEVTVDIETGQLSVDSLVMAVDSGVIINPLTASGQIEGGMAQALGYATCEQMLYDEDGYARERDLSAYHIYRSDEMPELTTIFVETFEPSHPFGVKAVAEIPMDGVAPAVGNAIFDACGAQIDICPATPERIWQAIRNKG